MNFKLKFGLVLIGVIATTSFNTTAQVKVGDNPSAINANSALEVESTNKGLLLPRVALTSLTSPAPLSTHVAGMSVYNTTNNPLESLAPGLYYNDGVKWNRASDVVEQTITQGSGAPVGACSNPGEMYIDTLTSSATNNQVWVCSGGSWVAYTSSATSQNTTPFFVQGTNIDAGGNKNVNLWRSGGIGFYPAGQTGYIWDGTGSNDGVEIVRLAVTSAIHIQRSGQHAPLFLAKKTATENAGYISFTLNGTNIGGLHRDGNTNGVKLVTTSDARLKENIRATSYGIEDLMKVGVKDYNYIADSTKSKTIGFIAQELYKVYPEAVTVGGDDIKKNPWTVDYAKLTPLLVKGIQDQQQQIQDQQKEIAMLRSLVNEKFAQLEQQNISKNKKKLARKKSEKKSSVLVSSR